MHCSYSGHEVGKPLDIPVGPVMMVTLSKILVVLVVLGLVAGNGCGSSSIKSSIKSSNSNNNSSSYCISTSSSSSITIEVFEGWMEEVTISNEGFLRLCHRIVY